MNYRFILEQAATSLYTTIRMYDFNHKQIRIVRKDPDIPDDYLAEQILSAPLLKHSHVEMPLLFFVNQKMVFAWVETKHYRFLLGPMLFTPPILPFVNSLEIPDPDINAYINMIPVVTVEILVEYCTILYNSELLGNEEEPFLDSLQILYANCLPKDRTDETLPSLTKTIFDHIENSFAHNPYNHEKLEVNYIKNGDVDSLQKLLCERFPGRYGKLSEDPLKQEIYLSIVAITIACRAAIAGGMYPETAFSLSDVSIRRVDACKNPVEMLKCTCEAELHFARMVRDLKREKTAPLSVSENEHIIRCKDYIFSHLHGKITVSQIADAIGLEPNYLSSLFKRHESISLKSYIRAEKVKLIKNLLTFSTYSFTEISAYLGFSSQSHMGMEFKKVTGMTLREYRSQFSNDDFLKESMTLSEN